MTWMLSPNEKVIYDLDYFLGNKKDWEESGYTEVFVNEKYSDQIGSLADDLAQVIDAEAGYAAAKKVWAVREAKRMYALGWRKVDKEQA